MNCLAKRNMRMRAYEQTQIQNLISVVITIESLYAHFRFNGKTMKHKLHTGQVILNYSLQSQNLIIKIPNIHQAKSTCLFHHGLSSFKQPQ